MLKEAQKALRKHADKKTAEILQRFFKTGPGEYGEGDIFIGVKIPLIRKLTKQYRDLELTQTVQLLKSPVHEERMLALLILVSKYSQGTDENRKQIYDLYLSHTLHINSWDLVDLTAAHIVGSFLNDKDTRPLYKLSRSKNLWERRISIISTHYFIKNDKFGDTLKISEILLTDRQDLIHKAVGWMLREVGKRNLSVLEKEFLNRNYNRMPRTMLRYAIEKFPEAKRQAYLKGKIQKKMIKFLTI